MLQCWHPSLRWGSPSHRGDPKLGQRSLTHCPRSPAWEWVPVPPALPCQSWGAASPSSRGSGSRCPAQSCAGQAAGFPTALLQRSEAAAVADGATGSARSFCSRGARENHREQKDSAPRHPARGKGLRDPPGAAGAPHLHPRTGGPRDRAPGAVPSRAGRGSPGRAATGGSPRCCAERRVPGSAAAPRAVRSGGCPGG